MSDPRRLKRQLEKICKNLNNPIKNKYPFRYLNILDEYITAARTNEVLPYGVIGNDECPKNKDITFIQFALVRIGDIKTKKLNPARAVAIKGDSITEIEVIITNGSYRGWKYVPPVINERGELIAGYHRYEGHLGVWGPDGYMWVAICSFKEKNNDGGAAAEFDYNEMENEVITEFGKKQSSYNDILKSTRYGFSKGWFTLEEMSARVKKKKLNDDEKRKIIETIQIENGEQVDLHKTVRRPEVHTEYVAMTGKKLDFVASISIGDTIINNSRLLSGVLDPAVEGRNMNIGISTKHTPTLKVLNEERERLQKELSPKFAYEFCKKAVERFEDPNFKTGEIILNFKDQYENDEWKMGVKTENV